MFIMYLQLYSWTLNMEQSATETKTHSHRTCPTPVIIASIYAVYSETLWRNLEIHATKYKLKCVSVGWNNPGCTELSLPSCLHYLLVFYFCLGAVCPHLDRKKRRKKEEILSQRRAGWCRSLHRAVSLVTDTSLVTTKMKSFINSSSFCPWLLISCCCFSRLLR